MMTSNLPVALKISAQTRRDGIPCVKAGQKISIQLTRKSKAGSNIKIDSGALYIIDPFGRTISKIPFRFGPANIGKFALPLDKMLLSGFYTILVAFQETRIKLAVDKYPHQGPPEDHFVLGCFLLEGGHPPIVVHRVNYSATVTNTMQSPINNMQVNIASPPSLPPRQDILNVKLSPRTGVQQNDLIGNRWFRFLCKKLSAGETFTCGYTVLVRNRAIRYVLPTTNPSTSIPANIMKFTQPENFIESHHHLIKDLARDIAEENVTPIQYIQAAMKKVTNKMRYVRQEHERGAAYAIEKRVGDCTEYAALFTALCRANKIPARLEAGYAFDGKAWERHAWSQVWIRGQWIPVDPTWHGAMGLLGVTNRHIPLIIGNWMDPRIRQEFKVSWHYQTSSIDGKKGGRSQPQIQTGWKVKRVVSVPESVHPKLQAAPAEIQVQIPDAIPRGNKIPLKVALIPITSRQHPLDQMVMTATISDGLMDQVVAIEPFAPRLQSPINLQLNIQMPTAAPKVTLNIRLWADHKPTSTYWQKTIGLI
ncbi:MAG: transglutaminase family protein [Promethearchaeota archaeon]